MNITTDTPMSASRPLLQLLQLVSPTLPIGAFAYSQGLESAIDQGWVHSEETMESWLLGVMNHSLAALDVPVMVRLHHGWCARDVAIVDYWNAFLMASRETAELWDEERQLGQALARLLRDLSVDQAAGWAAHDSETALVTMFALAAQAWQIPLRMALEGYLWSWCENQVAAAIKAVPLGQTAGQRLLMKATQQIGPAVELGMNYGDDEIGQAALGVTMASMRHETQYSRLFRS